MRRTVDTNESNAVLHAAYEGVEDGIQLPVVIEVTCSSAAGLNDDCQRQRLRVGVFNDSQILRDAVVGEEEVVSREFEDYLPSPGLDENRRQHQSRAHGQGRWDGFGLLRWSDRSEAEEETEETGRSH